MDFRLVLRELRVGFTLVAAALILMLAAPPASALPDQLYAESFDEEKSFPTTPDVDNFVIGALHPGRIGTLPLSPSDITLCDSIEPGCPAHDAALAGATNQYGGTSGEILFISNDTSAPSPLSGYSDSLEIVAGFRGYGFPSGAFSAPFAADAGVFLAELNGAVISAQINNFNSANTGNIQLFTFSLGEQTQGVPGSFSGPSVVITDATDASYLASVGTYSITMELDRSIPGTVSATATLELGNTSTYPLATGPLSQVASADLAFFGQFLQVRSFDPDPFGGPHFQDYIGPQFCDDDVGCDLGEDFARVYFDWIELNGIQPTTPPPNPVLDFDLDGVEDEDDNCVDVFNPDQDNADGDMFGTACDNCPKVANDSQADSDEDSYGDACDSSPGDPAEDLVVSDPGAPPPRPGGVIQLSATFKNPSPFAILTARPDCFNTAFEVRKKTTQELLDPRHLIRKPYNTALAADGGDFIKLEKDESYTISCNLADHVAHELLNSGVNEEGEVYEVIAHYHNDVRDPNCEPEQPGFEPDIDQCTEITAAEPGEVIPTFLGVVSSAKAEVTVVGPAILPEETVRGSCVMAPNEWFAEWAGIDNKKVVATLSGLPVDEVDSSHVDTSIRLEGILAPEAISKNGDVVLDFDRSSAVSTLGSLNPGDERFIDVTGLLAGPTGAAFEASCKVRIGLAIAVEIDIKPGSDDNKINLGSNGNVPVAIFSSDMFDATNIDPATVTMANANLKVKGKGTPMANVEDVNSDGLPDLIVHIETQGLVLTATSESAELAGRTIAGTPIFGTDSVQVKE